MHQATAVGASMLTITPDGQVVDSFELSVQDVAVPSTPLDASINALSTSFIQGELLHGSLTLQNDGTESELLRFTNTCQQVTGLQEAMASCLLLDQANCRTAELDVVVGASSQTTFSLQSWAFVDETGCSMLSGDYILVAEVPEFGYAALRWMSTTVVFSPQTVAPPLSHSHLSLSSR